mmetsp:Transcript_9565/g.17518  ORF Transcript_9565/g.17518 Transcript_9565/m.17518 type:complete len:228 (-) Transcript_9565:644-1327(-)
MSNRRISIHFHIMHISNSHCYLIRHIKLLKARYVSNIIPILLLVIRPQLSFNIPSRSKFIQRRIGTVRIDIHHRIRTGQPLRCKSVLPMTVIVPVGEIMLIPQRFEHCRFFAIRSGNRLGHPPNIPPIPVRQITHEFTTVTLRYLQFLPQGPAVHARQLPQFKFMQVVAIGKCPLLPFVSRFAFLILQWFAFGLSILFGLFHACQSTEVFVVVGVGRDNSIRGGHVH